MQSVFEKALNHVLAFEGGYGNDPADPGGETIYGISRRHHPKAWATGRPTRGDAALIYRRQYWDRCHCDELPSAIAVLVFDGAVNQGVVDSVRFLQRAAGAKVDGIIGPLTIAEANNGDTAQIARGYAVERAHDYALLNHLEERFGRGWMRRLFACYDLARALL